VNERPRCQRSGKQASMQWGERAVNSQAESGQVGGRCGQAGREAGSTVGRQSGGQRGMDPERWRI